MHKTFTKLRSLAIVGTSALIVTTLLVAPTSSYGASTNEPLSMSFLTPTDGVVLSAHECAKVTCVQLAETSNAGASWKNIHAPTNLVRSVRFFSWATSKQNYLQNATFNISFASLNDGWIYGSVPTGPSTNVGFQLVPRLWATHDAGASWQQIRLARLGVANGVLSMASYRDESYLMGVSRFGRAEVFSTTSTSNAWKSASSAHFFTPAGGATFQANFQFAGSHGWLEEGNDRGTVASATLTSNHTWRTWTTPPCAHTYSPYAALGVVNAHIQVAVCALGEWGPVAPSASPPGAKQGSTWLYISYNSGATFKPLRELSANPRVQFFSPPGMPATPRPGTIVLEHSTPHGEAVVRSTNWGRSWTPVLTGLASQLTFVSATTGYALVSRVSNSPGVLYRTSDAGAHWTKVTF